MMANQEQIQEQVHVILRELAEALNFFPKETAQMMYAKQLAASGTVLRIPEQVTLEKKMKTEEGNQRLQKMMEEAQLKWDYASDRQKKNVQDMEAMIAESDEKIRLLYLH